MAYEKKSIRAIIDDVNSRRVYLPAIQRKYVWGDSQITRLMDSIMLGYPIGTFLFWRVKKTIVETPEDAIQTFLKVPIDSLYLEDLYISKSELN